MNAKISSIRLKKNEKGYYWLITLIDNNGNIIGTFGDENHCSDIDFRNQTFNIMKTLNNWDLLNLDGQRKFFPVSVDNDYGKIHIIANSSGDYLEIDYETGKILNGTNYDISKFHQEYISNIISKSGTLFVFITSDLPGRGVYTSRGVSADLSYLGFKPLYSKPVTEEKEKLGAESFRIFICGLLNLCNINELIQSNNYPEVSVKLDSTGKIIAIENASNSMHLKVTDSLYDSSENKSKLKK